MDEPGGQGPQDPARPLTSFQFAQLWAVTIWGISASYLFNQVSWGGGQGGADTPGVRTTESTFSCAKGANVMFDSSRPYACQSAI
eukprot:358330-Pelagomonas_calceolata.AAC.2